MLSEKLAMQLYIESKNVLVKRRAFKWLKAHGLNGLGFHTLKEWRICYQLNLWYQVFRMIEHQFSLWIFNDESALDFAIQHFFNVEGHE